MSMHDWANREVEIAKKQENGFTYGEMCYDSALKAYLSLCEDGHSGMSFFSYCWNSQKTAGCLSAYTYQR